jgi:uncharacterized protein YdiU (UPF0061 family)
MLAHLLSEPDVRDGELDTGLVFTNRFAALPSAFFTRLMPQALSEPQLVGWSDPVARLLGLPIDVDTAQQWLPVIAGQHLPKGGDPLASVYSGHQFGVWAGQLGDGRALLLGEIQTPSGPLELQLKGAGKTPYSRMGDGRAVLRSSIREFLCSEAMAGLGIPTTRALGVAGSAQPVIREGVETAAVVLRVAPSFIRFGHFEHFASRNQLAELKALTDFVIRNHFPECNEAANPALALLQTVVGKTARLIAQWQAVGFMHGVMNSDNMSVLGLTIDYGPFGFMDAFDAGHICNHSDTQGRYAYYMQPQIGHWNCACLAQALLPLIDDEGAARTAVNAYIPAFEEAHTSLFRAKLGLLQAHDDDAALINRLIEVMHASHADWTTFFRALSGFTSQAPEQNSPLRDMFIDREGFDAWATQYRARLQAEASIDADRAVAMNRVNPKYVLRNHLAEIAIRQARDERIHTQIERLLKVLLHPFDEHPEHQDLAALPPDWASHLEVSCSS